VARNWQAACIEWGGHQRKVGVIGNNNGPLFLALGSATLLMN